MIALAAFLMANATPSQITAEAARKLVLMSIAYNAPRVEVDLNQESDLTTAFERSGQLTRANPSQQRLFSLTEKGRALAAQDGWLLRYGILSIAVGRFVLDPTAPIRVHQDGSRVTLTVRITMEENDNGKVLASIAPAGAWPLRSFPDLRLTLGDDGRVATITINAECSGHADCSVLR